MIISAKGHHALDQHGFDLSVPDNLLELHGAIWALAYYEVLTTIESRLGAYARCNHDQLRRSTNPAIDGRFIKKVVADMSERGVLTVNDRKEITAISPTWRDEIMG